LKDKTASDVYYFAVDCKADYDGYIGIGVRVNTIPYYGNAFMRVRKASNNFFRLSQNLIMDSFGPVQLYYGVIARQTAGICSYQNPVVINLTKIFGAGNEPSAEYIESWIKDVIIPINGQVQLPYLDSDFTSKDSVVIAGSNVNVPNAVKCTGYCDEFTITGRCF
jgi:hypothetical protein